MFSPPPRTRAAGIVLVFSLLVTALAFLPVLRNGFTDWDDDVYLIDNPLVRDLSPGGVQAIFTTYVSGNYHPLVMLLHAFEYRLFGLDPRPYHAVSLALHLLNTALVWWLLRRLGAGVAAALAGTLFFSIHPMRVESVAWIADRKDLLHAALFLGSLITYQAYTARRSAGAYLLSLLLFLLALFAKATGVALPLVLVLCDWLREGRVRAARQWDKIPYLVLAVPFSLVALRARETYQGTLQEGSYDLGARLFIGISKLVGYYLARSAYPAASTSSLYPEVPGAGTGAIALAAPLLVIFGLTVLVILSLLRTRFAAFGLLFFLVTLSPSLTVVVLGYSGDRFSYLPAVGLSALAVAGAALIPEGHALRRRKLGAAGAVLACALGLLLARMTHERCAIWRSSVTLWTDALANYPDLPRFAWNRAHALGYRGRALLREGRAAAALADLDRAVTLMPGSQEFLANRGAALGTLGRHREAVTDFTAALNIGGPAPELLADRGVSRLALGAYQEAADDFNAARRLDPGNSRAAAGLAAAVRKESPPHGIQR